MFLNEKISTIIIVALHLRPDTRFVCKAQLLPVECLRLNTSKVIICPDRYPIKKP